MNNALHNLLENGHNYSKMSWGDRRTELYEKIWSKIGVLDDQIDLLLNQNIDENDSRVQNIIFYKKALRKLMKKMEENKELKYWVETNLFLINEH